MRIISSAVLSLVVLLIAAASAIAGTPPQVTYDSAKILHGAPFIHGQFMTVVITERYSTSYPTQISLDCRGDAFGRMPTFGIERYGRENLELFSCQNLTVPALKLKYPGPVTKALYHNRKLQAMHYACRSLQRTAVRHKHGRNLMHVPCQRLRVVDSTAGRTVLRYRIRSRSDVRSVVLQSNGVMTMRLGSGFKKTIHVAMT